MSPQARQAATATAQWARQQLPRAAQAQPAIQAQTLRLLTSESVAVAAVAQVMVQVSVARAAQAGWAAAVAAVELQSAETVERAEPVAQASFGSGPTTETRMFALAIECDRLT